MVDPFLPVRFPDHPSFGVRSAVPVPIRSMPDALPLPPPMGPSPRVVPVSQDSVSASKIDFTGVDQSQKFLSRADASFAFPDLGIAKNLGSSWVSQSKVSSLTFSEESDQSPGLSSGNGRFPSPPDAIIGQMRDLRSDHIVPSDLTVGLEETDPSSRRRVNQRWYYEPKDSTFEDNAVVPVLSKRRSKPPQRLTASRLGMIACVPVEPANSGLSDHPAGSSSLLSRRSPSLATGSVPGLSESDLGPPLPHDRRNQPPPLSVSCGDRYCGSVSFHHPSSLPGWWGSQYHLSCLHGYVCLLTAPRYCRFPRGS
jgi:hypothetical protein